MFCAPLLWAPAGFDAFRGRQLEAIQAALNGKDSFVLMPTGGGKSLCYALLPAIRAGLVLVVSPLIALMQDQVEVRPQLLAALACWGGCACGTAHPCTPHTAHTTSGHRHGYCLLLLCCTPAVVACQGSARRLPVQHPQRGRAPPPAG